MAVREGVKRVQETGGKCRHCGFLYRRPAAAPITDGRCQTCHEEIVAQGGRDFWAGASTASQQAEEEAVDAMYAAMIPVPDESCMSECARAIYSAIRDGKVPGVKLEGVQ